MERPCAPTAPHGDERLPWARAEPFDRLRAGSAQRSRSAQSKRQSTPTRFLGDEERRAQDGSPKAPALGITVPIIDSYSPWQGEGWGERGYPPSREAQGADKHPRASAAISDAPQPARSGPHPARSSILPLSLAGSPRRTRGSRDGVRVVQLHYARVRARTSGPRACAAISDAP